MVAVNNLSWKQKLRSSYIHHRNRLLKGYGEFAIMIGIFNNLMIIWIFLKAVFGISNRYMWVLPIVAFCVLFAMYLIGWIWDAKGLFKEDYKWVANRNTVMMEMYDELKLIKKDKKSNRSETS